MADLIITSNDLLDALKELLQQKADEPNGAWTVRELSEMLNVDGKRVLDQLGKLKAMGMLEVTRKYCRALDDRNMPIPAYRFKRLEDKG